MKNPKTIFIDEICVEYYDLENYILLYSTRKDLDIIIILQELFKNTGYEKLEFVEDVINDEFPKNSKDMYRYTFKK